jgi:hypothetical protein
MFGVMPCQANPAHPGVPYTRHAPRQVVGACTSGSFSFTRGFGFGIGYVAVNKLVKLCQFTAEAMDGPAAAAGRRHACVLPVLIRNTTSPHYRFAQLTISPLSPE